MNRITVLLGDPRLPDPVKHKGKFNEEDFDAIHRLKAALEHLDRYRFRYCDDHSAFTSLTSDSPAFVLNFCDEGYRNEASRELHIPALLDIFGIPYSGAGPECLALCRNKAWVRAIAADAGIAVPHEICLGPDDSLDGLSAFIYPALVKPNAADGSLGITLASLAVDYEGIAQCVRQVRSAAPAAPVLLQEFLPGAEYSVALLGNPGRSMQALPVLEVDYSALDPALPRMLTWQSKWDPESPDWQQIRYRQAQLDSGLHAQLIEWSRLLFERLECRDYARFDFRAAADGEVRLLEVNPNPGWSWDGKLNLMASFNGISYTDLLGTIIRIAQHRLSGAQENIFSKSTQSGR